MWSARLYEQLGKHVGHVGPVTCLALDGNFLLSGGEDCSVRLWDLVPATRYMCIRPSIHGMGLGVRAGTYWLTVPHMVQ